MKKMILSFIVFVTIATVYATSAVGLINSIDTPQYFTTEALLRNGNLNMGEFGSDPHYFIDPDYFLHNNETLNVRGYLFSVVTAPIHLISHGAKHLMSTEYFSPDVISENFRYELTITMLFSFISAAGIFLIYKTLTKLTHSTGLSLVITIALAFGTYVWKYSSFLTRQGLTVGILGMLLYLWTSLSERKNLFYSISAGLIHGLTYGLDPILCISLTIYIVCAGIYAYFSKKKLYVDVAKYMIAALFMITLISYGNAYFYGKMNSTHVQKWQPIYEIIGDETSSFVVSAPLIPVMRTALFSAGKIPSTAFSHFDPYPKIYERLGVHFAEEYTFYGMFIISPFLLIGFLILLFPQTLKKHPYLLGLCFIVFGLGIAGNSKIFGFWGGTQYDIRYFYPYSILLAIPTALAVQNIWDLRKETYMTFLVPLFMGLFALAVVYSSFMGWLGVINMFSPALTGERRIWLDLHNLYEEFGKHTFDDYLHATFMNRANTFVSMLLAILTYLLGSFVFQLLPNQHARMSLKGRKGRKHK